MDKRSHFMHQLRRVRRTWRLGLLMCDMMNAAGLAAAFALTLMLADFFLAFDERVLAGLDIGAACAVLTYALLRIMTSLRTTLDEAAYRTDAHLRNRREPVLCAYELLKQHGTQATEGMRDFLIDETVREGSAALTSLRFKDRLPVARLTRSLRRAGLKIIVLLALIALPFAPGRTTFHRILMPWADIPPYSRFVFTVTPDAPDIVYGGNADLSVRIDGPAVDRQVTLVTRYAGRTFATPCFKDTPRTFAQRIEKVVNPVEFCFRVGRARSRWHRVNLLLEPKVASAQISIESPAYSRTPMRDFAAGSQDIKALKGSAIKLRLTSNRPLAGGRLRIKDSRSIAEPVVIQGTPFGTYSMVFNWTLQSSATLDITLIDPRGTTNSQPFTLHQVLQPDEPPTVSIDEPPSFIMVTPKARVPFSGSAGDDLGLRRVDLVRTVLGYRDRVKTLATEPGTARFDFNSELDLGTLGVHPGETLEFYAEARDTNPQMSGLTASEVIRMKVISEDEYAQMLRTRATVEDFSGRFEQVARTLNDLRAELKRTIEEANGLTPEQKAERLRSLAAKTAAASKLLQELSKEFAIYDLEKEFHAAAGELAQNLEYNAGILGRMKGNEPTFAQQLEVVLKNIEEQSAPMDRSIAESKDLATVGKLMAMANDYTKLVQRQEDLVRRLERHRLRAQADADGLRRLGEDQAAIREQLDALEKRIREQAAAMPETYADVGADAIKFCDALDALGIPPVMQTAESAATNSDGAQAHDSAKVALERLQQLVAKRGEEGCQFGQMCRMKFQPKMGSESVRSTLQQMMAAFAGGGRPGGRGMGAAGGGSGDGDDGYSVPNSSPLNVPVIGPGRKGYGDQAAPTRQGAAGEGKGGGANGANVTPASSETLRGSSNTTTPAESVIIESVPAKYRRAIKAYFTEEERKP